MLHELRDFAIQLAPELAERKLYVVDMAEGNFPATSVWGFASDIVTPHQLWAAKWDGPGSVVGVNVAAITDLASEGQLENCIKTVVVHEMAHLLPVLKPLTRAMLDILPSEVVEARFAKLEVPAQQHDDLERAHGPEFIRRCAHLCSRALRAGHDIHLLDVLGYSDWLSPLTVYLPDYFVEVLRMPNATFDEIESLPLPQFTLARLKADCEYRQQQLARESGITDTDPEFQI